MTKRQLYISGIAIILIAVGSGLMLLHNNNRLDNKSEEKITRPKYVALGDSVSAGLGLYTESDSSICSRTNESYPHVLAKEQNLELNNVSCSGATLEAGLVGSQIVGGARFEPQVNSLTADTKLVTITVGANDIGWSKFAGQCLISVCGSEDDTKQIDESIRKLLSNLGVTLKEIRSKIDPDGTIYVTGYYNLYPSDANQCVSTNPLQPDETAWLLGQTTKLNSALKQSATDAGARFVAVDFNGHELCTAEPWIQDIQERAPYHPNEEGQRAIAKSISAAFGPRGK